MDTEWALERLEWWAEHALGARVSEHTSRGGGKTYDFAYLSNVKVTELRARHDQVRRIVSRVLGLKQLPDLLERFSGQAVDVMQGVLLCQEAIGRLKTDSETRAKLGSTGPSVSADKLHADIWGAAAKRWGAGNYSDAVQRAATFLNANIQDATGRHDVSDSDLMREAFSLAAPVHGKPRLRWPGDDSNLSVRAMRVGILNYSQGIFSAIRNIATHSTVELPEQLALEQLAALSVLARWVDDCEVLTDNEAAGD